KPFHFSENVLSDVVRTLPTGTSGKQFESDTHVLHLNRGQLILRAAGEKEEARVVTLESPGDEVQWGTHCFKSALTDDKSIEAFPHLAQFDAAKITFPLRIRSWQQGDVFRPLGMTGN